MQIRPGPHQYIGGLLTELKPIRQNYQNQTFNRRPNQTNQPNQEVRLIGEKGQQIGVMTWSEAEKQAQSAELDLVTVAAKANPPVYRLMDYGRYQYQQKKKEKKQREIKIKGIRIRFKTDEHDLVFKAKRADGFLQKGDKVRADILLRGRERAFLQPARHKLEQFLTRIETEYKFEQTIKRSPQGWQVMIAPAKRQ